MMNVCMKFHYPIGPGVHKIEVNAQPSLQCRSKTETVDGIGQGGQGGSW